MRGHDAMNHSDVKAFVIATIASEYCSDDPSTMCEETLLMQEGLLDSFSLVKLLVTIHLHFGVPLELDRLEEAVVRTPRSIADHIFSKL